MNSVRSNSLQSQRSPTSGCTDMGIKKFEFAAKTQFLYVKKDYIYRNVVNVCITKVYVWLIVGLVFKTFVIALIKIVLIRQC